MIAHKLEQKQRQIQQQSALIAPNNTSLSNQMIHQPQSYLQNIQQQQQQQQYSFPPLQSPIFNSSQSQQQKLLQMNNGTIQQRPHSQSLNNMVFNNNSQSVNNAQTPTSSVNGNGQPRQLSKDSFTFQQLLQQQQQFLMDSPYHQQNHHQSQPSFTLELQNTSAINNTHKMSVNSVTDPFVKLEEFEEPVCPSEACTLMLRKRVLSELKMEEDEDDDDSDYSDSDFEDFNSQSRKVPRQMIQFSQFQQHQQQQQFSQQFKQYQLQQQQIQQQQQSQEQDQQLLLIHHQLQLLQSQSLNSTPQMNMMQFSQNSMMSNSPLMPIGNSLHNQQLLQMSVNGGNPNNSITFSQHSPIIQRSISVEIRPRLSSITLMNTNSQMNNNSNINNNNNNNYINNRNHNNSTASTINQSSLSNHFNIEGQASLFSACHHNKVNGYQGNEWIQLYSSNRIVGSLFTNNSLYKQKIGSPSSDLQKSLKQEGCQKELQTEMQRLILNSQKSSQEMQTKLNEMQQNMEQEADSFEENPNNNNNNNKNNNSSSIQMETNKTGSEMSLLGSGTLNPIINTDTKPVKLEQGSCKEYYQNYYQPQNLGSKIGIKNEEMGQNENNLPYQPLSNQEINTNIQNMKAIPRIFQLRNPTDDVVKKLPKIYSQNAQSSSPLCKSQQNQQQQVQLNLKLEQSISTCSNSQVKNTSKFHNRNKLFINGLIRFFTKENLQKLQMSQSLFDAIFDVMEKARLSGRQMNEKKVQKTDLFNHSHYNLLFQKLNEKTINYLKKTEKDVKLHKDIFDIDLKDLQLLTDQYKKERVEMANFLKNCIYDIIIIHLQKDILGLQSQEEQREYEYRAFKGIEQMIEGNIIQRF